MSMYFGGHKFATGFALESLPLQKLEVDVLPTKKNYIVGDTFQPEGTEIKATFSDDSLPNQNYTFDVPLEYIHFEPTVLVDSASPRVYATLKWAGSPKTIEVPINVHDNAVYGVAWNYGKPTVSALTRIHPETDPFHLVTDITPTQPTIAITDTTDGESYFNKRMPWAGMKEVNIIDGEVKYTKGVDPQFSRTAYDTFVYIPEFYYMVKDVPETKMRYFYISDAPHKDMYRHPGSDRYVGRYLSTTGFGSKSQTAALYNTNLTKARAGCIGRGNGYFAYDVSTYSAIWLLYLVEFADWNSQTIIGPGGYSHSSKSGITDSMQYHTGYHSNGIQYRGIDSQWGSGAQILDGLLHNNSMSWICTDPTKYANTVTEDYLSTGIYVPYRTGTYCTVNLGHSAFTPFAFLPTSYTATNASSPMRDQYYRISVSGADYAYVTVGGWNNSESYGLFSHYGDRLASATSTYTYFRTRLVFDKKIKDILDNPVDSGENT